MKTAIKNLIERAGSERELAKICGVTQQSVSKWLKKGYIPSYSHGRHLSILYTIPVEHLCDPDIIPHKD